MSIEHRFTITGEHAQLRLDRCLAALHSPWTRSHARRLVDEGCVTVNGRAAKPSQLMREDDVVIVREEPPRDSGLEPEEIPLDVLYEDEHLIAVNKPAGLVIHPAAGNPAGTLVNALLHHCNDLSGIGGVERPGIVHRLDKDTTGVIVAAKTDTAHQALSLAFRWRKVHKTYLALCYGRPEPAEGFVDAPIGRHPRERQMMAVTETGRTARTLYEVEEDFGDCALVSCRLITGRTHQIRVHLAHLGHALVGDPLYAGRQWKNLTRPAARRACREFPRQALHAFRLGLEHPVSGEPLLFEAPLPADFEQLLKLLRSH